MNLRWGDSLFTTSFVYDNQQGFERLELHCVRRGVSKRVATALFLDASGQFFVETFDTDVPADVVERCIAEAKASVKVR
jgi:hypothetical protein